MSLETNLSAATLYLAREGTWAASDLGLFAVGDAGLCDRLESGTGFFPGEATRALPFIVDQLDAVIAKLIKGRAMIAAGKA